MNRHEFNSDLGRYIESRKGASPTGVFYFFSKVSSVASSAKKQEHPAITDKELHAAKPQQQQAQSLKKQEKELETMEAKIEEIDDIEHTVEEKREGLLTGFFKKLRIFNKESDKHVLDIEESPEAEEPQPYDEDVRRVLKMTYSWLDYLPEEKVLSFKKSEDFDLYKKVLSTHGLIKQQPAQADAEETDQVAEKAAKEDDF